MTCSRVTRRSRGLSDVLADRIGVPGAGGDRFPAPAREADVNERTDTGTMDPHGRGDEIPALTTCVRFTPSRPSPPATTRTPPTFRLAWADPETAETGARRARLAQCDPSATESNFIRTDKIILT